MEGGGGNSDAKDYNKMVLTKLDDLFGNVSAVTVRWYVLVSHARGTYSLFIFL